MHTIPHKDGTHTIYYSRQDIIDSVQKISNIYKDCLIRNIKPSRYLNIALIELARSIENATKAIENQDFD